VTARREAIAPRNPFVVAEGSLMRRITLVLTVALACLAGLILVPGAAAGNFDEEKMGCAGQEPATCPTGTVGQPYSLTIYLIPPDGARGEDFACATFHATSGSLPPGLSISDEGILSGTPTQGGRYEFFLTVKYDKFPTCTFKNPSDDSFILNVAPQVQVQRLFVATNSLPDAQINQAYTAPALVVQNGTVSSWTLAGGSLPPGLTLGTNGVISGTPTQSGTFTFTVQANGSPNNDTKQLSLFVLAPLDLGLAPTGTPASSQPVPVRMKLATPFSWGVKATGGREPYAYTADRLPAGITLNPDGTLTGTPTVAGVTRTTFTVRDARGTTDTLQATFTTQALLAFHKTKQAKVGKVGRLYSWRLPVAGASETKVFLVSGRIPPGLELDEETGFVTGTPLTPGTFRVRFWVLGDAGTQISKTYRVKIQGRARTVASR
jgi:large repetitive protein